jgi:superfamily I DNA/RNA helicase
MTPSSYQQAIYDWIEQGTGNALVDAVAGAGKTSTLIEGAKRLQTTNACFVAFNKVIADEIASRLQSTGSRMQASTIHSLGKRCLGKVRIESNKYLKLCRRYFGSLPDVEIVLKDTPEAAAVKYLRTLVNFAHLTMSGPTEERLLDLVLHYALDDLLRVVARNPMLWETIWSGVSVVTEMGIEQYQRERLIDFNDMVCLPTVLCTSKPQFDFLLVDEAQDLNQAQLELILGCQGPNGRLLFVGDSRQCQPPGTMVRLTDGSERPIEQLHPGDTVITYDRRSASFVKKGVVGEIAARHYDGLLYTIKAGMKQSHCTDSHKWLVRWCKGSHDAWVTYLMRQGNRYRVGQTRLFLKEKKGGNFDFGLANRARQERADAAWILQVHESLADALVYEQIVSAKYGLPEAVFTESDGIKCYTQEMLDRIFTALSPQEANARRCLGDHGRRLEYPLYTRGNEGFQQRQGRTTLFETQACNLISGFMALPVAQDQIDYTDRIAHWEPLEVTTAPYSGPVYSLNVEKHHKYIADGLVTCNSIYGFAGADTESINNIIQRTHATVLPLSICYRCPKLSIQMAQQIYPHIQPSPTAERGTVEIISQADFLRQVQPNDGGCAVIGRCTAPLVSLCLKLLQQGKRAKVRGRDIGAGILDLLERLKKSKHFHFAAFLELLEEYRDAQLEILGNKPDNEMAIDAFLDKVETVVAFYQAYRDESLRQESRASIEGFESYITDFFSDEDDRQCILFSTIHKAKGLEFNVVYALPEKVPHPLAKNAWQYEQELNAEYVLLTRSRQALYFIGRLISNLQLPTDTPAPIIETLVPAIETPAAVLAEAEAIVATAQEEEKRAGGRPRKHKERLQIKVSSEVAAYLRSLKGGDDGYSGYLETLIQSDPRFRAFTQQPTELSDISCV